MSPNPPRKPRPALPKLGVEACWNMLSGEFAGRVWSDLEEAMTLAGLVVTVGGVSKIVRDLLAEARGSDTGPLSVAQRAKFRVLVWRWCASTAEGL